MNPLYWGGEATTRTQFMVAEFTDYGTVHGMLCYLPQMSSVD